MSKENKHPVCLSAAPNVDKEQADGPATAPRPAASSGVRRDRHTHTQSNITRRLWDPTQTLRSHTGYDTTDVTADFRVLLIIESTGKTDVCPDLCLTGWHEELQGRWVVSCSGSQQMTGMFTHSSCDFSDDLFQKVVKSRTSRTMKRSQWGVTWGRGITWMLRRTPCPDPRSPLHWTPHPVFCLSELIGGDQRKKVFKE